MYVDEVNTLRTYILSPLKITMDCKLCQPLKKNIVVQHQGNIEPPEVSVQLNHILNVLLHDLQTGSCTLHVAITSVWAEVRTTMKVKLFGQHNFLSHLWVVVA